MKRCLCVLLALALLLGCACALADNVLYKQGDRGAQVLALKKKLTQVGCYQPWVNGGSNRYDQAMADAVSYFQKQNKLTRTGEIDQQTYDLLFDSHCRWGSTPIFSAVERLSKDHYAPGESGEEILKIKRTMQDAGYYRPTADFDNAYNDTMVQRVKLVQKTLGMEQTGEIDWPTLYGIYRIGVTDGPYYVKPTPTPRPTPTPKPEPAFALTFHNNARGEWKNLSGDKLQFRVKVSNDSSYRTVTAFELYIYPTDTWGDRMIADDRIYAVTTTKTIGPGKSAFSDYVTLPNRSDIYEVYVAIRRVRYSDGTVKTLYGDDLNYWWWTIK